MRPSRVCKRVLVVELFAVALSLAVVPSAFAEPADADAQVPAAPGPASSPPPVAAPAADGTSPAAADACRQFSGALAYAADNYEEFAYATAGNGNNVNYADPRISDSNVAGRTALREAAGVALTASQTPGLPPEIANPMRTWSFDAARLVLTMGLRGGGDSLNAAAADLNNSARDVQMACAAAGAAA
ncbi:MAG: hypothetical protein WAM92_02775 [Mycobacterium sp.]